MPRLKLKTLGVFLFILMSIGVLGTVILLKTNVLSTGTFADVSPTGFSAQKGVLYDNGIPIYLHGVNWFGVEGYSTNIIHGLWARSYKDMIQQMKGLGINAVRLPYCPKSLQNIPTASNSYVDLTKNSDLVGTDGNQYIKSLDALDKIITELNNQKMYFILDNHNPDCIAQSDLWYTSQYSENQWISDLELLATRYSKYDYFAGLDLKNEPRNIATWGTGNTATDWNLAAERAGKQINAINPNILIFVEGIAENQTCSNNNNSHFWGENLEPFACTPINTNYIPKNKLILSPHIYGPDVYNQSYFNDQNFPNNMNDIWNTQFGYLINQGYTIIPGEWGGKDGNGGLDSDVIWHNTLASYYIKNNICNSFYWSWNADSGDTGGILKDDWTNLVSSKVTLLQNYWNTCKYAVTSQPSPVTSTITKRSILPTQTSILVPPPVATNSKCNINYNIKDFWNNGFVASVSITNISNQPINKWNLKWTNKIPGQSIINIWNAKLVQSNSVANIISDSGYNAIIGVNSSISAIGFQGNNTSGNVPELFKSTDFYLNDNQCGYSLTQTTPVITTTIIPNNIQQISQPVVKTSIPQFANTVCTIQYSENRWDSGFSVNLTLNNTTNQDISSWKLKWTFPSNDQNILEIWNAGTTLNTQNVIINNASWNQIIPQKGNVQFGFNGKLTNAKISTKPSSIILLTANKSYGCTIY